MAVKKLYRSIFIVFFVLPCIILLLIFISDRETDYVQFFKHNQALMQEISEELIKLDVDCEIKPGRDGNLKINYYKGRPAVGIKDEIDIKINQLFKLNEFTQINIGKGYVEYILAHPPNNYHGWCVYDPNGEFGGGVEPFTEQLSEDWILEILPNT